MIIDSTYKNNNDLQLINDLAGKPYSFFERILMKGVGSKKMIIDSVSPNFKPYINSAYTITYANIELRKGGVLVHINKGLKNYIWAIPYYQLVVFKTNGSSIHAQGRYINFRDNNTFKQNKSFFSKMLDEKIKFEMTNNFLYQ